MTNQDLGIIVDRTDALVAQLRLPQMGFAKGCYPDESWLMKIVRFIDSNNLLGFFVRAIHNAFEPKIAAMQV